MTNRLPKPFKGQPAPVAFSYRRFSNAVQVKGDSLRRQAEPVKAWCDRNSIPLDLTLAFDDKGKSAFRGKNAEFGELRQILQLIHEGERIWPGCYLLIENLDRLSRQNLFAGLAIIQQILEAGIRIVTLVPERVYTEAVASDQMAVIEMCLTLIRAHEESLMKSKRCGDAWQNKRDNAATKPMGRKCPGWIVPMMARNAAGDVVVDHYRADPERAAILRRLFRLASEGVGVWSICREFNAEAVPTFGRAAKWSPSTVHKYLRSRQVLGEFQPCKLSAEGKRVPDGNPIAGYFPGVIEEKLFDQVQEILDDRKGAKQRNRGEVQRNLFGGLLFDVTDGNPLSVQKEGGPVNSRHKIFNNVRELNGGKRISFPYEEFEQAILALVADLDYSAVSLANRGLSKEIREAAATKRKLETKLAALAAEFENEDSPGATVLKMIGKLEKQLTAATERFQSLLRQQQSTPDLALKSAQQLGKKLRKANAAQTLRIRRKLTAMMPQFITRIDVLILRLNRADRAARVRVTFANGRTRDLDIRAGMGTRQPDTTIPAELDRFDLADWKRWPKRWRKQVFSIPSNRDADILARYADGETLAAIGKRYGISKVTVKRVVDFWGNEDR